LSGKSGGDDEVGSLPARARIGETVLVISAGAIKRLAHVFAASDDVDDSALGNAAVGIAMTHGAIALVEA
jgi:hypothetical protein